MKKVNTLEALAATIKDAAVFFFWALASLIVISWPLAKQIFGQ